MDIRSSVRVKQTGKSKKTIGVNKNTTNYVHYPILTYWFIDIQSQIKKLSRFNQLYKPVMNNVLDFLCTVFCSNLRTYQNTNGIPYLLHYNNYLSHSIIQATLNYNIIYKLINNIYLNNAYNFNKISKGINISNIKTIKKLDHEYSRYSIILNFKKQRFFPHMYNILYKKTLFNSSLGIFSRNFSNKKSFLKSKASYMMSATFLRRMLIYLRLPHIILKVVKVPRFLKDIIFIMLSKSNALYTHPYSKNLIIEKHLKTNFLFDLVIFTNNKCYGPIKKKKRGRLKRKISKKLFLYNNIID